MKKSFGKKLLCVIVAILIAAANLPFYAVAASSHDLNLGIISDVHYFAPESMGSNTANFIKFSQLNNSTTYLAPAALDCALAAFEQQAAKGELEFVIIPGDLTRNGEKAGHLALAARLRQFEQETGIPVYIINGNHDINNFNASKFDGEKYVDDTRTTQDDFREIYREFGYDEALSTYTPPEGKKAGALSYTVNLGDKYRLIALDGGRYTADNTDDGTDSHETAGSFTEDLLKWAVNECKKAEKEGRVVIGMNHFNIVPHFETEADLFQAFVLKEWERMADTLADAGMHYMVSGHLHSHDIAEYVSDNGEKITDIATASLINYPNMFRTLKFSATNTKNVKCEYISHDIDEVMPVIINGEPQEKPFKYQSFGVNFGKGGIKSFIMNLLEYQLKYGFGADAKEAGGLYYYLTGMIDFDALLKKAVNNDLLGGASASAVKSLLFSLCTQIDRIYLSDPDNTIAILEPMIDELLSTEIADVPCTKFKNTLGFGSTGSKGTVADLASTVLAYHYTNNEDPSNDKFLNNALDRFYNNQNGEIIVDALFNVILDDLLQDEILTKVKIDPLSLGINGEMGDTIKGLTDTIFGALGIEFEGIGLGDILSFIFSTGVAGENAKLSDAVRGLLGDYLNKSQYEIIDGEFYRILRDLTHDKNPAPKADYEGFANYNGKTAVPVSAENMRLPSNIAVTFGKDSSSTRNISFYTKYSLNRTDIQIVPYSKNPDFSKGSTVKFTAKAKCEPTERHYSCVDLGFIGIIEHPIYVNRHTISVSGLQKGKKYSYRIGDAARGWWSEPAVLETADNTSSFGFIHSTDPQSVTEMQYADNWASMLGEAFKNHDAKFILSTGDMVDHGGNFRQWQRMFNTASDSLMSTSLMAASGNHEAKEDYAQVNNYYLTNLPKQETASGAYYSFDYNTAHFAVLNTNDLKDDGTLSDAQLQWLKDDMTASKKPWKFVALHKAPYSNGAHFDDSDVKALRKQFASLMPELDIDIVFQGHDHVYMRTGVLNNNELSETETQTLKYNGLTYTSKVKPDGTIYSINGTSGSKHYTPKDESETKDAFPAPEAVIDVQIPTYSYIQIDGGNLYFDSYSFDGKKETRIDSFALSKVVTLPDGTVVDGTAGNKVVPSDKNDDNGSNNVSGNITDTSSAQGPFVMIVAAVIAVFLSVTAVTVCVIVKRRREEA